MKNKHINLNTKYNSHTKILSISIYFFAMHHVAAMLSTFSSFLFFRRLALLSKPSSSASRQNVSIPREVVVEAAKGHVTPFRKRVESRVALQKRTVY